MNEKMWCSVCATWGEHRSGGCPQMGSALPTSETAGPEGSLDVAIGSGLVAIGNIGRFKPLKLGKIHLKCRRCKNTRSNMVRSDFDPVTAAVMVLNYCPRCDKGGDFEEVNYFDAAGRQIFDSDNTRPNTAPVAPDHKSKPLSAQRASGKFSAPNTRDQPRPSAGVG